MRQERSIPSCVACIRWLMSITPHIVVQGADRAAAFYRDAFGAEELTGSLFPTGG